MVVWIYHECEVITLERKNMQECIQKTWEAWDAQDRLVYNAAEAQGRIIKAYIEANKGKLTTIMVQDEHSSHGQLTIMLQIPPTYNTYYYRDGHFYREVDWAQRQEQEPPVVSMVVGERLQELWQNSDFVKSLLGMDLIGGSMPYGAL